MPIKSKYIYELISLYSHEDYIYNLITYSKSIQKKLNLDLNAYKRKYFLKRINKYFYDYDNILCSTKSSDKINISSKELELLREFYKNYFFEIIKELNPYEFSKYIDFCCPFFDVLLKTVNFEKYFTILIRMQYIHKNNLIDYYREYFEKINKLNIKYSLEFTYCNIGDLKYLKEFKINFTQIKKLNIRKDEEGINESHCLNNKGSFSEEENNDIEYIKSFYNTLFSFENIEYNLISLSLNIFIEEKWNSFSYFVEMDPGLLEGLNNLKSLKYLYLYNLEFSSTFILKLFNLEKLKLKKCKNIIFKENYILNLKSLNLEYCKLANSNSKLKFPELETLVIKGYHNENLLFDFSSMTKLKCIITTIDNFLLSTNILLEETHLFYGDFKENYTFVFDKNKNKIVQNIKYTDDDNYSNDKYIDKEKEIMMIDKFCSIKSLKKIQFPISKIIDKNNEKLNKSYKNESVKEMNILITLNDNKNYDLCNLQNIFFNLTNLNIEFMSPINNKENRKSNLKIIENPNCKLTSFNLLINMRLKYELKLYIQSYEILESINFDIKSLKFNTNFPIFNNKCDIIFKSLKSFRLCLDLDLNNNKKLDPKINNLYENIEKMPNLREFTFLGIQVFNRISLKHLVRKILSLKFISNIYITAGEYKYAKISYSPNLHYSKKELQKIFPDISFNKLKDICIMRFL